jgi:hypothetical protein
MTLIESRTQLNTPCAIGVNPFEAPISGCEARTQTLFPNLPPTQFEIEPNGAHDAEANGPSGLKRNRTSTVEAIQAKNKTSGPLTHNEVDTKEAQPQANLSTCGGRLARRRWGIHTGRGPFRSSVPVNPFPFGHFPYPFRLSHKHKSNRGVFCGREIQLPRNYARVRKANRQSSVDQHRTQ